MTRATESKKSAAVGVLLGGIGFNAYYPYRHSRADERHQYLSIERYINYVPTDVLRGNKELLAFSDSTEAINNEGSARNILTHQQFIHPC